LARNRRASIVAVFHEIGIIKIPPRWFLIGAAQAKKAKIQAMADPSLKVLANRQRRARGTKSERTGRGNLERLS
jgi:hypothetical protein